MAVQYGIRKGLEDIAYELKGIRDVMLAIWQVKYGEADVDCLNPDAYADEYISTEECDYVSPGITSSDLFPKMRSLSRQIIGKNVATCMN